MQKQQTISAARLAAQIGTTQLVIIDSASSEGIIGRTRGDAPEIDGIVRLTLPYPRPLQAGNIVPACITGADEYDLTGEILPS